MSTLPAVGVIIDKHYSWQCFYEHIKRRLKERSLGNIRRAKQNGHEGHYVGTHRQKKGEEGKMKIRSEILAGPFRRCDWRHREARRVSQTGRLPSPRLHSEATRRLVMFYQQYERCRTDLDHTRLRSRMPSIFEDHRLSREGHGGIREIAEAMVLAREQADRIASWIGVKPSTISVFEEVYFDVRSRLDQYDFIVHQVIGINRKPQTEQDFLCKAMKFYAYLAGPLSLEVFQFYAGPPIRWQPIREVFGNVELRARALAQFKALDQSGQTSQQAQRDMIKLLEWNREHKGRFGDENGYRTPAELQTARFAKTLTLPMP